MVIYTDWLGQYPIYYWKERDCFAVSNNILILEAVVGITRRSVLPAVCYVATGGALGISPIENVGVLVVGDYLSISNDLVTKPRADHGQFLGSYSEAIQYAHESIKGHIMAALNLEPPTVFVTDLTGGSDSRAVLSFLLPYLKDKNIKGRCITRFPHPDANIAGALMERYGIAPSNFPTSHTSREVSLRRSAGLTAGAKGPGAMVPPVAFTDLVHFKGSFGEIAGATPGGDVVAKALATGSYSHELAADLLIEHRRMARATRLLTKLSIAAARSEIIKALVGISQGRCQSEQFISELYLRSRSRSHFGLGSVPDNRGRILPEPLANRWMVEARRLSPMRNHINNNVIFDLIYLNSKELAYMPMAGKRWDEIVLPNNDREAWASMAVIGPHSPSLSSITERLYHPMCQTDVEEELVKHYFVNKTYAGNIAALQSTLKYFLETCGPGNDVWDWFDRTAIDTCINKDADDFINGGSEEDSMASVCQALIWIAGLELPSQVLENRTMEQAFNLPPQC